MITPDDSVPASPHASGRWIWVGLKWSLFAAVILFVGLRGRQLWQQDDGTLSGVTVQPGWLVLSGAVYAVGWLPSVWFWRELMLRLGGRVGFADATRAYYCGHLGKYVPGKAMVLVIRSAMVKDRGTGVAVAAVTATVETLLMMGTGLAVAVALAPLLVTEAIMQGWPAWIRQTAVQPGVTAVLTLTVVLVSLPLLARLLTVIGVRMTPQSFREGEQSVRISSGLVAKGLAAFIVSWACHGLSLGLTIQAVSPHALNLADWPVWMGAVAAATAIGFAVLFAPGGVGVREGLLIEFLQVLPAVGPQQAVVAAVLLRIVWFTTEIVTASVLYYAVRAKSASDD
jgi:hypothetical protein